jgi:hypothetical protein
MIAFERVPCDNFIYMYAVIQERMQHVCTIRAAAKADNNVVVFFS